MNKRNHKLSVVLSGGALSVALLTCTLPVGASAPAPSLAPQMCLPVDGQGYFQGVSLNKTMEFLNGMNKVEGAYYDKARQEIVFVGEGAIPIAERIELDDLVVAVRSVFRNQNPGVSFETGDTQSRKMINQARGMWDVRYEGATEDTQFGQILFEADYLLKLLTLGITPSGEPLASNVEFNTQLAGFESFAERLFNNFSTETALLQTILKDQYAFRFWFQPRQVAVRLSESGEAPAFIFDPNNSYEMELAYEVVDLTTGEKAIGGDNFTRVDGIAAAFSAYITNNYSVLENIPDTAGITPSTYDVNKTSVDKYYFSTLKKLKRLGRITAVVHWIHQNKLPIDLSFLESYTPAAVVTPNNALILRACEQEPVPGKMGGSLFDVQCDLGVNGGILYHLDNTAGTALTALEYSQIFDPIKSIRPEDPESFSQFAWPEIVNEQTKWAVAQSVSPRGKDGKAAFTQIDLMYPNKSGAPLAFARYYDSFSWVQDGMGPGWAATPYSLMFPFAYMEQPIQIPVVENPVDSGIFEPMVLGACEKGEEIAHYPQINLLDRTTGKLVSFFPVQCVQYQRIGMVDGEQTVLASTKRAKYMSSSSINDVIYESPFDNSFMYLNYDSLNRVTHDIRFAERTHSDNTSKYVADVRHIGTRNGDDSFNWLEFKYDENHHLQFIEDDAGKQINVSWNKDRITEVSFSTDAGRRAAEYQYTDGRLKMFIKEGRKYRFDYDPEQPASAGGLIKVVDVTRGDEVVVAISPDAESRTQSMTPEGDLALKSSSDYFVNPDGSSRTEVIDPRGMVTTEFDIQQRINNAHRLANITYVDETTSDESHHISYTYDDQRPGGGVYTVTVNKTSQVAGGATRTLSTVYELDDADRVIRIIAGAGLPSARETTFLYTQNSVGAQMVVVTNPKGRISARVIGEGVIDEIEYVNSVTDNTTSHTLIYDPQYLTRTTFNVDTGAIISVSKSGNEILFDNRNEFGQAALIKSAAGYSHHYSYDSLARLKHSQSPADVLPVSMDYYEQGLNQDKVSSIGSAIGRSNVDYDYINRIKRVTDPRGVTKVYVSNRKGQLDRVVEISPNAETVLTTQYFYDVLGQLESKLLPNGTYVTYQYDELGRMKNMSEIDNPPSSNSAPVFSTKPEGIVTHVVSSDGNNNLIFSFSVSDGDLGDQLSYDLIKAPEGMEVQGSNLVFNSDIEDAGTHVVVVQVSDGNGGVATINFTLDILLGTDITDTDADGVKDSVDNCIKHPNPTQHDSDLDRFGNACDADFNNDGIVNFADLAIFKSVYGGKDSDANLDGDKEGIVNAKDFEILETLFALPPGPSAHN